MNIGSINDMLNKTSGKKKKKKGRKCCVSTTGINLGFDTYINY